MTRIDRPWGRMWLLWHTTRLWVKIIRVDEGHRTSLQSHKDRAELHIRLNAGTDNDFKVRKVPKYRMHRMGPGLYLEIAWGCPNEEDIVRYADDYDRETE